MDAAAEEQEEEAAAEAEEGRKEELKAVMTRGTLFLCIVYACTISCAGIVCSHHPPPPTPHPTNPQFNPTP